MTPHPLGQTLFNLSRVARAGRCHRAQHQRGRLAGVENGSGIGKLICETGH